MQVAMNATAFAERSSPALVPTGLVVAWMTVHWFTGHAFAVWFVRTPHDLRIATITLPSGSYPSTAWTTPWRGVRWVVHPVTCLLLVRTGHRCGFALPAVARLVRAACRSAGGYGSPAFNHGLCPDYRGFAVLPSCAGWYAVTPTPVRRGYGCLTTD